MGLDRECELRDEDGFTYAIPDLTRELRCGTPEAIFAAGKTPEQTLAIAKRLSEELPFVLVTRANPETLALLKQKWPDGEYEPLSGAALIGTPPTPEKQDSPVLIVCAGTSDLPVSKEALLTLRALGIPAEILSDVGVAGLHRLLSRLPRLRQAPAIIAVAGMEGALPSVLAGLVRVPVIAVPTSVGYGASLGGLAALLGMLNGCSAGTGVVNIDNGFGAACLVARILGIKRYAEAT